MVQLIIILTAVFSISFFHLFVGLIGTIREERYIKKAINDKAVPKPIECLSTGDTLYLFDASILKDKLTNLTEENINEDIFKDVFDTYTYVCRITSFKEHEKHMMQFGIESMFEATLKFSQVYIAHEKDKKKYVVKLGSGDLVSSSLKLLSVYVHKMIQDSKNATLEMLNKKAEAYNADDVYHWLEEIKGKSLSVR